MHNVVFRRSTLCVITFMYLSHFICVLGLRVCVCVWQLTSVHKPPGPPNKTLSITVEAVHQCEKSSVKHLTTQLDVKAWGS